jgi:hypothetical protein
MIKLNATDLVNKRKELISTLLVSDYENAIHSIHSFFENEDNLLKDSPTLILDPKYTANKDRIKMELEQQGFVAEYDITMGLIVKLPIIETTETIPVDSQEAVQIEIVTEAPKEETKPQVVVKPVQYNHTDLQMNGGDPF